MSSAWIKDGKVVVNEDGKPIVCDECPCGPPAPIACNDHDVPAILYVTFSGTLSFGPTYSGTVRLRYRTGPLGDRWYSDPFTGPCSGNVRISMACMGDGTFQLSFCDGLTDVGSPTSCNAISGFPTPTSYSPFLLSHSGTTNPVGCGGSVVYTADYDVTEVAP